MEPYTSNQKSIGGLIRRLADDAQTAIRKEVELARVELSERAGDDAPEHGAGVRRHGGLPDQRTLISPIGSGLYEPKVPDIPRERRLRDLDAPPLQLLSKLLLTVDGFPIHQLEHERLPIGLHNYSKQDRYYTHYA